MWRKQSFYITLVLGVALLCLFASAPAFAQTNMPGHPKTDAEKIADALRYLTPGRDRVPRIFGIQGAHWRKRTPWHRDTEVTLAPARQESLGKNSVLVGKMVDVTGFEPATPCLQSRCSPS
jgi:hypothetical protein